MSNKWSLFYQVVFPCLALGLTPASLGKTYLRYLATYPPICLSAPYICPPTTSTLPFFGSVDISIYLPTYILYLLPSYLTSSYVTLNLKITSLSLSPNANIPGQTHIPYTYRHTFRYFNFICWLSSDLPSVHIPTLPHSFAPNCLPRYILKYISSVHP